jgi:hypothetical protein
VSRAPDEPVKLRKSDEHSLCVCDQARFPISVHPVAVDERYAIRRQAIGSPSDDRVVLAGDAMKKLARRAAAKRCGHGVGIQIQIEARPRFPACVRIDRQPQGPNTIRILARVEDRVAGMSSMASQIGPRIVWYTGVRILRARRRLLSRPIP